MKYKKLYELKLYPGDQFTAYDELEIFTVKDVGFSGIQAESDTQTKFFKYTDEVKFRRVG